MQMEIAQTLIALTTVNKMKLNSIDEAISEYENITGESFDMMNPTYTPIVLPSNEFMLVRVGEHEGRKWLEIGQMYGYSKSFVPIIWQICENIGTTTIITTTQRNPKFHIRKWHMKRLPEWDYDYEGRHYFVLEGHVDNYR